MKLARYQAGMGLFGWLFMLALVGFVVIFIIKLTPVYMENATIRSVLQGLKAEASSFSTSEDVRRLVSKRFGINNIKEVDPADVIIEPRSDGGFAVQLDYERRVPFVYNISLVTSFSESVEVPGFGGAQ